MIYQQVSNILQRYKILWCSLKFFKSTVLGSEENAKREVRQVAVNVGPVGVGVGPFGGVGVRVGNLFNLGVAPSNQISLLA